MLNSYPFKIMHDSVSETTSLKDDILRRRCLSMCLFSYIRIVSHSTMHFTESDTHLVVSLHLRCAMPPVIRVRQNAMVYHHSSLIASLFRLSFAPSIAIAASLRPMKCNTNSKRQNSIYILTPI